MANYVPTMPTLSTMQVGDTINYKGADYLITALGSYVDDLYGRGHRTVTFSVSGVSTTITCSTKDTTISSYRNNSPTTQVAVWSQSVAA